MKSFKWALILASIVFTSERVRRGDRRSDFFLLTSIFPGSLSLTLTFSSEDEIPCGVFYIACGRTWGKTVWPMITRLWFYFQWNCPIPDVHPKLHLKCIFQMIFWWHLLFHTVLISIFFVYINTFLFSNFLFHSILIFRTYTYFLSFVNN